MSNYTLTRADRATHLKIVAVSLIAGILVIGVGIAARSPVGDGSLRIEDNGASLNGTRLRSWSSREPATIR
jgi:hypothetical protein